jgi:hypothetical protein
MVFVGSDLSQVVTRCDGRGDREHFSISCLEF